MSDKRPDDINPGKRPGAPHPAGPGTRRPVPDGHTIPHPAPHSTRRPAAHPATGERPLRRITPGERPTPQRINPEDSTRRPRPQGDPATRNRAHDGYPKRRPSHSDRDFLAPDDSFDDNHDTPPPRSRARRRTQLAAFNIVMIVIIAGILLTVFAMTFRWFFDSERQATVIATPTPDPTPTPLPIDVQNLMGLVTGLNDQSTPRMVTMFDIETNQTRQFSFLDTTTLANRSGISMTFSMLAVGNMMEIAYNAETNELLDLRQSFTRDFHSRTGVRIDMENSTITLGNDVLNFTSQTLVIYRGNPAVITDITDDDTITIVAVGDVIWLIQIESGNGFLQIANASTIMNGRIILEPIGGGTHRITAIDDIDTSLPMSEGTYRVTVEGTNIETYITELVIRHGETTILDLSDVEPGMAILELAVTPSDSLVFINGARKLYHREPMEFEFGESLTIRVEREGYVTQERSVEMTQVTVGVNISLEEEIITGQVTILTEPIGANVWINNQHMGQSPVVTDLAPGTYTVALQMYGFYDFTTSIYVPLGESSQLLAMTQITVEPPYTPGYNHYPPYGYTPQYPPYNQGNEYDGGDD